MNEDAEMLWDKMIGDLRRSKGLHQLDPAEAKAEFDIAPESPLNPDQIDTIVEQVMSGELVVWDDAEEDMVPSYDAALEGEAVFQAGPKDKPSDSRRDELLDELRRREQDLETEDQTERSEPTSRGSDNDLSSGETG